MLEINKDKQNTLFSLASILCISHVVNRIGSLSSSCRKQFLFPVIRNLRRSNWLATGSQLWTDHECYFGEPGKVKYQEKGSFA